VEWKDDVHGDGMKEMVAMMRCIDVPVSWRRSGGTGACQDAQLFNFFVNRITDPIELSMPIKDMRHVAVVEERKWNETRVAR
jgi:hypothetical protein